MLTKAKAMVSDPDVKGLVSAMVPILKQHHELATKVSARMSGAGEDEADTPAAGQAR